MYTRRSFLTKSLAVTALTAASGTALGRAVGESISVRDKDGLNSLISELAVKAKLDALSVYLNPRYGYFMDALGGSLGVLSSNEGLSPNQMIWRVNTERDAQKVEPNSIKTFDTFSDAVTNTGIFERSSNESHLSIISHIPTCVIVSKKKLSRLGLSRASHKSFESIGLKLVLPIILDPSSPENAWVSQISREIGLSSCFDNLPTTQGFVDIHSHLRDFFGGTEVVTSLYRSSLTDLYDRVADTASDEDIAVYGDPMMFYSRYAKGDFGNVDNFFDHFSFVPLESFFDLTTPPYFAYSMIRAGKNTKSESINILGDALRHIHKSSELSRSLIPDTMATTTLGRTSEESAERNRHSKIIALMADLASSYGVDNQQFTGTLVKKSISSAVS